MTQGLLAAAGAQSLLFVCSGRCRQGGTTVIYKKLRY